MRLHHHLFVTASILAFVAACVGGPGPLPGEDGQQSLPSGSGTGSGRGGASSSSSGAGSSEVAPSTPPNVDPPVLFDAGSSVPKDSGTTPPKDSGTPGTCTSTGQTSKFEPAACQMCLEQQCCTQLRSCFTIASSGSKLNCNQYNDCLNVCVNAADPNTCQADCNATAQTGVTTAYNNIVSCAQSKCLTPCQ